jgi:hypothetical protein
MATPTYFSDFPNITYDVKMNKAGIKETINIKDYFHLLVPRTDIFRQETLYANYTIQNGERPDQISYKLYGDEQYYWIILQINEIVDYWSQWPLSQAQFDAYVVDKYGSYDGTLGTHHWETIETFDDEGNLVLPGRQYDSVGGRGGMVVSEDFVFEYPAYPGSPSIRYSRPQRVTIRQHEFDLNQRKTQIFVLQERYISQWESEIKQYTAKLKSRRAQNYINSGVDVSSLRQ